MADTLEQMLEPGEEVLYRARRSWGPNSWLHELVHLGLPIAIVAASGLLVFDTAGLVSLAAALAGLVLFLLFCVVRDWSREAVVTGRRLLHRSGWRSVTLTEVPARDVAKVEARRDRLRFTRHDGEIVELGHPHYGWGLGVALAHAAGLPPPRLSPRREVVAEFIWMASGMTAGLALAVVPLQWFIHSYAGEANLAGLVGLAVALPVAGWILHVIGNLIGGFLPLFLLRPFFSFEQMSAWIDHGAPFWSAPGADPPPNWFTEQARPLVGPLYGRGNGHKSGGPEPHVP